MDQVSTSEEIARFLSLMRFSIIIPAYNVGEYLQDCLASIQRQSFTDFEVLIVDDGSTDGTGRVAQEFADRDSRYRLVPKENGGVSSARNLGLERAAGEFVWFVDGDDYIHPESLAWLHRLIEESPSVDYVTFDYDWTSKRYDRQFPSLESLCQSPSQSFDCSTQEGFEDALHNSPIAVWCVCYRRRLALGCRFRNLCISEDRLYALEMCFAASMVVHTRKKLYSYYQRSGSACRQITRGYITDQFEFAEHLFKFQEGKNGWGRCQIYPLFCQLFTGIMSRLVKLKRRQDRRWAFKRLCQLMEKVQGAFVEESQYNRRIERIIRSRSFFLAWLFLVARHKPRSFLVARPQILRCYVNMKAWFVQK